MNARTRVRLGLVAFAIAAVVAVVASAQYTANHADDEHGARPAPTPSPDAADYLIVVKITPQPRRVDRPVLVSIVVDGVTLPPAPPNGSAPHLRGFTETVFGTMATSIVVTVQQTERQREPYGVRCELYRAPTGRPQSLVQVAETAGATTIKCATENAR